jgi:hypothetical protein
MFVLVAEEEQPQRYDDYTWNPEHPENEWWENASLDISPDFAELPAQYTCFHAGLSNLNGAATAHRGVAMPQSNAGDRLAHPSGSKTASIGPILNNGVFFD